MEIKYLFVVICLMLLIFPVTAYSHHHGIHGLSSHNEIRPCDPHQSQCYVCNGQVVNQHFMCIGREYRRLYFQP
jgi:hypothetical protein